MDNYSGGGRDSGLHSSTKPTRLCMNLNQTPPPVQGVSRTALTLSALFPLSAVPNPGNTHSANVLQTYKNRGSKSTFDSTPTISRFRTLEDMDKFVPRLAFSFFCFFSLSPFPSLSPSTRDLLTHFYGSRFLRNCGRMWSCGLGNYLPVLHRQLWRSCFHDSSPCQGEKTN